MIRCHLLSQGGGDGGGRLFFPTRSWKLVRSVFCVVTPSSLPPSISKASHSLSWLSSRCPILCAGLLPSCDNNILIWTKIWKKVQLSVYICICSKHNNDLSQTCPVRQLESHKKFYKTAETLLILFSASHVTCHIRTKLPFARPPLTVSSSRWRCCTRNVAQYARSTLEPHLPIYFAPLMWWVDWPR